MAEQWLFAANSQVDRNGENEGGNLTEQLTLASVRVNGKSACFWGHLNRARFVGLRG